MTDKRTILAVDPGETWTALAVLGERRELLAQALLDFRYLAGESKSAKLLGIAGEITSLLERWSHYEPKTVVIEQEFPAQMSSSLRFRMKLDGVIELLAAQRSLEFVECPVASIRGFLLGRKRPPKKEVKLRVRGLVQALLNLPALPQEDMADALAVGLYYQTCGTCEDRETCKIRLIGAEKIAGCPKASYLRE